MSRALGLGAPTGGAPAPRHSALALGVLGLVCWLGLLCPGCGDDPAPRGTAAPVAPEVCVHVVDVWGEPVEGPSVRSVPGEDLVPAQGPPVCVLPDREFPLTLHASAEDPDLIPASLLVRGGLAPSAVLEEGAGYATLAWADEEHAPERRHLFVGLDHRWYAASGRPPRAGCSAELLMDGEQYWSRVHGELLEARQEVLISTWWWQSQFELVRPAGHVSMTPEQRDANTSLGLLQAMPAVERRVLVSWFGGSTALGGAYLNNDPALRAHARTPDDGFEVLIQANPSQVPLYGEYPRPPVLIPLAERLARRPEHRNLRFDGPLATRADGLSVVDAASYHQKFLLIDRRVAFVSGMNVKSADWDSSEHRVYDARRMKFQTANPERWAVDDREALPDLPPRKDYGVRLQGPVVADVLDVFAARWAEGRAAGAAFAEHSTALPAGPTPVLDAAGPYTVQLQATLPAPFYETSILESHLKALGQAQDYIFIEDQYFRAPVLHEAMVASMDAHPELRLVVVTPDVALADGGKKYTIEADQLFRRRYPDRYLLLELYSHDVRFGPETPGADGTDGGRPHFVPINLHSKMMLVDDRYVSVGSANKNNRGYLYEAELNVSLHEPAFVAEARARIMANLLGPGSEKVAGGPFAVTFEHLRRRAEANAAARQAWRDLDAPPTRAELGEHPEWTPRGFVYPLVLSDEYLLEVGPDAF